MGKPVIRGGTPVGSESLCKTCSHAFIMTGYRESEMVAMCDNVYPAIVVPFTMYECTGYYDKNRPSWKDMQKFALDIDLGNPKPAGFKTGVGNRESAAKLVRPAKDEDDD